MDIGLDGWMKLYLKLTFREESNKNSSTSIQLKNNLRQDCVNDTMNKSQQQEKISQQRAVLTPAFCIKQHYYKIMLVHHTLQSSLCRCVIKK